MFRVGTLKVRYGMLVRFVNKTKSVYADELYDTTRLGLLCFPRNTFDIGAYSICGWHSISCVDDMIMRFQRQLGT